MPAALPLANLLPWTGWLMFEEFDLVVLGALAGGYARWAVQSAGRPDAGGVLRRLGASHGVWPLAAFAALSGIACARGLADAGGLRLDLFQGYADPLNAWRVFKPLPYALLAAPLAWRAAAGGMARAARRFAAGMLAGLAAVSLAVLWERAAYPGLFDWSSSYRATALFWEMHVGGAAIDGYLVLAAPFVVWALADARTLSRWSVAAALALLAVHALLATFSRGPYCAVGASLLLLAVWRRTGRYAAPRQPAPRWRGRANALLACALALECAAVLGASTFARERAGDSVVDLGSRVLHWRRGLGLLHGAGDWLFGAGTGRLPARYADAGDDGHQRSGALHLVDRAHAGQAAWVSGPDHARPLGGRYALAQRVDLRRAAREVRLRLRALRDAELLLLVCERHLLYAQGCTGAAVRVRAGAGGWQSLTVPLAPVVAGAPPSAGAWYAPRLGLFTLSVKTPGASVEVAQLGLRDAAGAELLDNGGFAAGLAHWFPAAQSYFLPWHVDNLYLELLIERGALSLLAFALLLRQSLRGALRAAATGGACGGVAPCVAASLAGAALLGAVGSVLDTPRVAFVFLLMLSVAAGVPARTGPKRPAVAPRRSGQAG